MYLRTTAPPSRQLAFSLFAITGERAHRELAQMFYKAEWMDALAVRANAVSCSWWWW